MARIFFPGCKIKKAHPEASERLRETVIERGWADQVAGCCRVNHQKLTPEDTAVVICNNCTAMIEEDADNKDMVSIWELIDSDPEFPLPDYAGAKMTLQDCARVYDRPYLHETIRSLIKKMNIDLVEAPDARNKSIYCGPFAHKPAPDQDAGFAPKRYTQDLPARGAFVAVDPEESERALAEHAAALPSEDVITYCVGCHAGIQQSGKTSRPLIELVFGV